MPPYAAAGLLPLLILSSVCCGPALPGSPDVGVEPAVEVEPWQGEEAPALIPAVARFVVTDLGTLPSALLLFEGALGEYHLGRIRAASLPGTLVARLVPSVTFRREGDGRTVLSPERPLSAGTVYTLAALGRGQLATYRVVEPAGPILARLWPPAGAPLSSVAVYCGDPDSITGLPSEVVLWPAGVSARVDRGADGRGTASDRCVRLTLAIHGDEPFVLPPVELDRVALDPSPMVLSGSVDAAVPPVCDKGEVRLGSLCALVEDDRAAVRSGDTPRLLSVETSLAVTVEVVPAGRRAIIGGLTPGAATRVLGSATDLAGAEEVIDTVVLTGPPRSHVVITEVLADPAGPEPAQEWVELVNDSLLDVGLAGFTLEDASGACQLPPAVLGPGAHALVVSSGYNPADGGDVPPAPSTPLLRVPRLGGNGLTNSGEALVLRDRQGGVVSRFPKVASQGGGTSVERLRLRSPDDVLSEFGVSMHPTPGFTRGAE